MCLKCCSVCICSVANTVLLLIALLLLTSSIYLVFVNWPPPLFVVFFFLNIFSASQKAVAFLCNKIFIMTSLRREKVIFTPSEEQRHRPCLLRPRCCVSLLTCSINLSVRDGRAECQWMMINHFVCDLVELRKIRLSRGFPTSCKERNLERVKESVKCNQQITHFFFTWKTIYNQNMLPSKAFYSSRFLFVFH